MGASDAYEFSFVAVPAQPAAGIVKGMEGRFHTLKALAEGHPECAGELERLEREALLGRKSGERARREAVRFGLLAGLGLDKAALERLVAPLSPEELDRCAGAVSVKQAQRFQYGEDVPERQTLEDGTAGELSAYLVELSDGQLRWYYWFDLKEMPGQRIQEVFTVDPSGNYQATDYAARLLWDVDGETQAVLPQVKLAGGKTAEELSEWGRFFASLELERFGYSHYSPWFAFSVPKDAQQARGYLALTVQVPEGEDFTGDFAYALLQHQIHWLRYPFQSVQALGGTQAVQNKGIARTLWTGVQYYP